MCFHSLIRIHRNLLGTLCQGSVPGVAVYGVSEDPAELVSTPGPPTPTVTAPHVHMIQLFCCLVYVLVHSGCSNEISQMAWLINHRVISHPSGGWGSKVKLSAWSSFAESSVFWLAACWYLTMSSHGREQGKCSFLIPCLCLS